MSSPADYANADAGMRDLLQAADAMLVPGKTPPGPARDNLARVAAETHSIYSNGDVVLTDHLARLADAGARLHEAMKLEDLALKAEEARAATAAAEASRTEAARVGARMEEDKAARRKVTDARAAADARAAGRAAPPTIPPARPVTPAPAPDEPKSGFLDSLFGSGKPKK